MARRFSDSAGIQFNIAPLSGYTVGPVTVAALIKRSSTSPSESPVTIYTSAFANRVRLNNGNLRLVCGGTATSSFTTASTSVWFLVVATWAGGAAVTRFHVHDGTSWSHANGAGSNSNVTVAGSDELHVGYMSSGTGTFDVVCCGIKKADRTDGQIETLSPLYFQTWRDFAFDWLIGFDASLTTSGAYQDQASPGTGDEIAKTGTTAVADPPGWSWAAAAAPAFVPQIVIT